MLPQQYQQLRNMTYLQSLTPGERVAAQQEARQAYETYMRRYAAVARRIPGFTWVTMGARYMRGFGEAMLKSAQDATKEAALGASIVAPYLVLKGFSNVRRTFKPIYQRQELAQMGAPGVIEKYMNTVSLLDYLVRGPFFQAQVLGGLLRATGHHTIGNLLTTFGVHRPHSIWMAGIGNPMMSLFNNALNMVGLGGAWKGLLGGIARIPHVGPFMSSSLGFMLPIMAMQMGLSIWKARRIAKLRGQDSVDVSRYSIANKLDPYIQQATSQGQLSIGDQIQLELLKAIERHTCIIPAWYQEWHHKYKATTYDYKQGFYKSEDTYEKIHDVFDNIQFKLSELINKFDPFSQLMTFLLTGRTPRRTLEILRQIRGEDRKELEKRRLALGVSYSQFRLMSTSGPQLVASVPDAAKQLTLLTASYDLQRFILAELTSIRRYGFGLRSTIAYQPEERKSILGRLLSGIQSIIDSIPGLSALVNVATVAVKGVRTIHRAIQAIPRTGDILREGLVKLRDKLFGEFSVLVKDRKLLLEKAGLALTQEKVRESAFTFLGKYYPQIMQEIVQLEYRKVGLLEEIAESTGEVADFLLKNRGLRERRERIRERYERVVEKKSLVWDPLTGRYLTQKEVQQVYQQRKERLYNILQKAFRSSPLGQLTSFFSGRPKINETFISQLAYSTLSHQQEIPLSLFQHTRAPLLTVQRVTSRAKQALLSRLEEERKEEREKKTEEYRERQLSLLERVVDELDKLNSLVKRQARQKPKEVKNLITSIADKFGGMFKGAFSFFAGAVASQIAGLLGKVFSKLGGFIGKIFKVPDFLKKPKVSVKPSGVIDFAKSALQKGRKLLSKIGLDELLEKGAKYLPKVGLKSLAKKIPILSAIAGTIFAAKRLLSGDFSGAALEFGSGLASTVPGYGTVASIGLDAALIAHDLKRQDVSGIVEVAQNNASNYGSDFAKAFSFVISKEGLLSADSDDPGGMTFMGISRRSYPDWEGWRFVDKHDFKTAASLVPRFYYEKFWKPLSLDKVPNSRIRLYIFDTAVNMGIPTAKRLVAKALGVLGVKKENIKEGLQVVRERGLEGKFLTHLHNLRVSRYEYIAKVRRGAKKYLHGWLTRAEQAYHSIDNSVFKRKPEEPLDAWHARVIAHHREQQRAENILAIALRHASPIAERYGIPEDVLKIYLTKSKEAQKILQSAYEQYGGLRGVPFGVIQAAIRLRKRYDRVHNWEKVLPDVPVQEYRVTVRRPVELDTTATRVERVVHRRFEQDVRRNEQILPPLPPTANTLTSSIAPEQEQLSEFDRELLETYPNLFVQRSLTYIVS